jgi:hypothetical protein
MHQNLNPHCIGELSTMLERMLANRDVEAIKLNTRLGNCNLKISAQLQNNDKAMKLLGEYAMQFLIWHSLGSAAFNKKSDFVRDSAYSDALSAHLKNEGVSILNEVFEGVSIETSAYAKPDPIAKLVKEFISLGMSEDDAKAMAKSVQDKVQPKTDAKAEASADVEV